MTAPAHSTEPAPTPEPPKPAPGPAPVPDFTPPASQADLDKLIGQRLNQERAKFGGKTAEQIAEALQKATKYDEAELEKGTDMQRAVAEAKKAAEQEAEAKYRPVLAETAFRVAIGDRLSADEVAEFIGETNMSSFIKDDGSVDTVKVLKRVTTLTAPAKGTQQAPPPKGPVIPGHAPGGSAPAKPGDSAKAFLASRGIKVD